MEYLSCRNLDLDSVTIRSPRSQRPQHPDIPSLISRRIHRRLRNKRAVTEAVIVQQPPEGEAEQLPYMEAHHVDANTGEDELAPATLAPTMVTAGHGNGAAAQAVARNPKDPTTWGKVGRNEACPCGSGKKYKHCHGRFA